MNLNEQAAQPSPQVYREIPLTQGQVALVDAIDYEWLSKWKWNAHWSPDTSSFYAVCWDGERKSKVQMSREILAAPKGLLVDHKNHDTLDNRRCNIRIATRAQNQYNSRMPATNKSGFKGVSWDRQARKWHASISVNDKTKHLGNFSSPEEAHAVYIKAAAKLRGDFACHG